MIKKLTSAMLAATAASVVGLIAFPAQASYPGLNGRVAFGMSDSTGRHIYSVLPNGAGLRQLTSGPYKDACPAYSADGKRIAFCSNRTGSFEIWAMTQHGGFPHQLTNLGFAWFPDYSPDGKRIAFSGQDGTDPNDEIFLMNADGTHLRQLTSSAGNNDWPVWSPDGRRLAFVSDRTGVEQVYTMTVSGSRQTQLTFAPVAHDQLPDWSPNGRKIAYTQGEIGIDEKIFVMNADGSGQHQISSGSADDFGPAWSPDGTKIAFVRDYLNGDRPVMVMNADGSDVRKLNDPGDNSTQFVPGWQTREGADD